MTNTNTTLLKVYLTNLGKYNEGSLIGGWVELPKTEDEIEKVLARIGVSDEPDTNGRYYEEYFISDYETQIEGLNISEYANIYDLNELITDIENFDEDELQALQAFLLNGDKLSDAIENVNSGNYNIYYNCIDMIDVAYEVVEQCGYLNNVPDIITNYFDYEAFGRDLNIEGTFYQIDDNMIELY